jgi:hypothetical protein
MDSRITEMEGRVILNAITLIRADEVKSDQLLRRSQGSKDDDENEDRNEEPWRKLLKNHIILVFAPYNRFNGD